MKVEPLVSVIIPTYKRPGMLGRAIDSVLNQTYDNIEVIVVDDNDEDSEYRKETEEFMDKYADIDKLVYLKHKKNKNGAAARNTGIKNSKGEYISFLDDDDEYLPSKLMLQVNKISKHSSDYIAVYCGHINVYPNENNNFISTPHLKGNIYKELLTGKCPSSTSLFMVKKEELVKVNGFDEKLQSFQDYDLWLRLFKDKKTDYVEEPLVKFYHHLNNRVSRDIVNRLSGLNYIINKWEEEINKYSNVKEFENKYKKMTYLSNAKVNIKNNNKRDSLKLYVKALKISPLDIRIYFNIILALMGKKVYSFIEGVYKKLKRKSNNSEVKK